jgi:hypothetical protein
MAFDRGLYVGAGAGARLGTAGAGARLGTAGGAPNTSSIVFSSEAFTSFGNPRLGGTGGAFTGTGAGREHIVLNSV